MLGKDVMQCVCCLVAMVRLRSSPPKSPPPIDGGVPMVVQDMFIIHMSNEEGVYRDVETWGAMGGSVMGWGEGAEYNEDTAENIQVHSHMLLLYMGLIAQNTRGNLLEYPGYSP